VLLGVVSTRGYCLCCLVASVSVTELGYCEAGAGIREYIVYILLLDTD